MNPEITGNLLPQVLQDSLRIGLNRIYSISGLESQKGLSHLETGESK